MFSHESQQLVIASQAVPRQFPWFKARWGHMGPSLVQQLSLGPGRALGTPSGARAAVYGRADQGPGVATGSVLPSEAASSVVTKAMAATAQKAQLV